MDRLHIPCFPIKKHRRALHICKYSAHGSVTYSLLPNRKHRRALHMCKYSTHGSVTYSLLLNRKHRRALHMCKYSAHGSVTYSLLPNRKVQASFADCRTEVIRLTKENAGLRRAQYAMIAKRATTSREKKK